MAELVRERRRMRAARSLSLSSMGDISREHIEKRYKDLVTRSYSPARGMVRSASMKYLNYDPEAGIKLIKAPIYPTKNITVRYAPPHSMENQPLRKYDVYNIRTWTYPVWKYIYTPAKRYSPYLQYATHYTPPLMTTGYSQTEKTYSYPSYMASDHSFHLADRQRPSDRYHYWRCRTHQDPWYYGYFGHGGLRHFGGFRPRYISNIITPYW